MPDLEFACIDAEADRDAASPSIRLRLRLTETTGTRVYAVGLRCQVRIEPQRRRYDDREAEALQDLFGDRSRWSETLKTVQLAFLSHVVPSFSGSIDVDLELPCSYDFDVAAHKYLYALDDGEVPLLMLFNGTVFTVGPDGIAVLPLPWHKEARYRLPVRAWQEAMDLHFPNTAWLRLPSDTFDALYRYRTRNALLTWQDAVERLLKEADR